MKTPKHTNYSLALLLAFISGGAMLLILLLSHNGLAAGEVTPWLLKLIFGTQCLQFLGGVIAGSGYIGQFIDKCRDEALPFTHQTKHPLLQRLKAEKIPLIGLGIGLCLALTLTLVQLLVPIPVLRWITKAGSVLPRIASFVMNVGMLAGLGNRLSRVGTHIDKHPRTLAFWQAADINYTLAIVGGCLIGVAIMSALIATGGPVFIIAGMGALSACASAGGYVGRVFDLILGERPLGVTPFKQTSLKSRFTLESTSTLIGVIAGITLGLTLIAAGAATLPFFGLGSVKLLAGVALFATCVSVCGGLGNRLGHAFSKFKPTPHLVLNTETTRNAALHQSLRAECLNGVQARCLQSGVPSKENTHQHRHTKPSEGFKPEYRENPVRKTCNDKSNHQTQNNTQYAADHGQNDRLNQEEFSNIALRGTYG